MRPVIRARLSAVDIFDFLEWAKINSKVELVTSHVHTDLCRGSGGIVVCGRDKMWERIGDVMGLIEAWAIDRDRDKRKKPNV